MDRQQSRKINQGMTILSVILGIAMAILWFFGFGMVALVIAIVLGGLWAVVGIVARPSRPSSDLDG